MAQSKLAGQHPRLGPRSIFTDPFAAAICLTILFGAWEILFAGFMADDLLQLSVLEGVSPAAAWTGRLDLYTISDGDPAHVLAMKDAGFFPWFFEPRFEMDFLRPLSSALLAADHALFGLHPAGYRLHGVLWSLALVAAVGSIFRRALPKPIGGIALLVFVVSGIQGIFCWAATRHVVIAAALGFAALAAHMRWREENWRAGAVLSVTLLLLSLSASEVGLAAAAYLLAYEALAAPGSLATRLRAGAPTIVVLAVYLLVWHGLGRAASSGTGYLDPLHHPGLFMAEVPGRMAVLLGGMVLGGSADLWALRPDLRQVLIIVGAAASLGFGWLLWSAWPELATSERRAARWLGIASVLSALPFTGTPIGTRCLLVPFVGGAVLISVVLRTWWVSWRGRAGFGYAARRVACAFLAIIHIALAPLGRLGMPVLLQQGMAVRAEAAVRDAELDPNRMPDQTVVVLRAPDLVVGLHARASRALLRLPMPDAWRVLSWAPGVHRFVRTGPDTLDMEVDGAGISSPSLTAGSVVELRDLQATVLATGALGPTRVRFRFQKDLNDPSMVLLSWRDGRLRRVEPTAIGTLLRGE